MGLLDRIEAGFDRAVWAVRRRSRRFDHAWRAGERFTDVLGGRLAAAISYYAFFAAYSLGVLAFSVVTKVLGSTDTGAMSALNNYLQSVLPWVAPTARDVGRGEVTLLATIGLLVSGIGWVESLRSSVRAIWLVDQHPGHWALRRFVDLGVLFGLAVLLGLSLATTNALETLLEHLVPHSAVLARVFGPVVEFVVNLAFAAALLTVVPRMRLSPRRLAPAALFIAIGVQLLNTVGRLVISHTEHRPAYAAVAGAVGLLVYLYLLNQVTLFGSALAATARNGTAVDLGQGMVGIKARGELLSGGTTPGDVGEPRE